MEKDHQYILLFDEQAQPDQAVECVEPDAPPRPHTADRKSVEASEKEFVTTDFELCKNNSRFKVTFVDYLSVPDDEHIHCLEKKLIADTLRRME